MPFDSPDIDTFKHSLDSCVEAVRKMKLESHVDIKIQSLLNLTIYVMATRFVEGSTKNILYNCCIMRGDDAEKLERVSNVLKNFNNPEFKNISDLFRDQLNFDITLGKNNGRFSDRDITFLNEIVINRHKNVHASYDPSEWYNQNKKDLVNFEQEYCGLLKIITYLESIRYDSSTNSFK